MAMPPFLRFGMKSRKRMRPVTLPGWSFYWRSAIYRTRPAPVTTLSQMRSVLSELTRSVRALELSLVEARREDSWNFARTGPSEDLRSRVERQLKHDLALRQQRLEFLTGTIAGWAMMSRG